MRRVVAAARRHPQPRINRLGRRRVPAVSAPPAPRRGAALGTGPLPWPLPRLRLGAPGMRRPPAERVPPSPSRSPRGPAPLGARREPGATARTGPAPCSGRSSTTADALGDGWAQSDWCSPAARTAWALQTRGGGGAPSRGWSGSSSSRCDRRGSPWLRRADAGGSNERSRAHTPAGRRRCGTA